MHHKVAHREYNIKQQNAKTLKQYDAKMHKINIINMHYLCNDSSTMEGKCFSEPAGDGGMCGAGMTRGMLIGGGSVPVKSKLMSVVGADDVLSYDTENK